jgi:hypothetical protein
MTARFHEGQDVEVRIKAPTQDGGYWRKAKIVDADQPIEGEYIVKFPDGTLRVFDADRIRAVSS